MIIDSRYQQPAVNVYPNGGYFGGGNGGLGDGANGGWFWIVILFFFAIFGGWGNNGASNGGGSVSYVPYYGGVQQGFDQAAIMSGINGIQNSLASAEVSRCNQQANILATLNANQNSNVMAMNSIANQLSQCLKKIASKARGIFSFTDKAVGTCAA